MDFIKVILTSVLSAVALFIITKVLGHKQMSQLDIFDYVTGITIGSIAAELATELEEPLKPLVGMLVYGLVAISLSFVSCKFPRVRKFINGTPTILMNDGNLYRKNFKKAKLELSEFMVMCRQEGFFDLSDIQTAVFEYNGRLTVLPKATKRPVNPTDINLVPKLEKISVEVIMDGRILEENLKRLGFDIKWLQNELAVQGYKSEKQIYLGICDYEKNITFYPIE